MQFQFTANYRENASDSEESDGEWDETPAQDVKTIGLSQSEL